MAEITFLAPGSCQLEVTAQGSVGTDTGVDLASVSWTIEQALIAGCRFSPSAGDVHIDRNGVLTIGRSLFDRINQADGDESIPGQCTLVIRADSTITKTVLDRFKVLVGYPGEVGGGGVQLGQLYSLGTTTEQVTVGRQVGMLFPARISLVKVGGSIVSVSSGSINKVALGTVAGITYDPGYSFRLLDTTIVNGDVHGDPVFATAAEVTGAVEAMNETIGEGDDAEVYEGAWVTLPAEIAEGHTFVLEILKS